MLSIGNIIGIPFGFGSGLSKLPTCIADDAISWYKNLNSFVTETIVSTIEGLLDYSIDDNYIELSSVDITGDKTVTFSMYVYNNDTDYTFLPLILNEGEVSEDTYDCLSILIEQNNFQITTGLKDGVVYYYSVDISDYLGKEVVVKIVKTANQLVSVTMNGEIMTITSTIGSSLLGYKYFTIGSPFGTSAAIATIWNVNIDDTHTYVGYPSGDQDSAWVDTTGSNDGTVIGTGGTIDVVATQAEYVVKDSVGTRTDDIYYGQYLDTTSGQINFYRTSGTFDYTDPSDGSLIEGVSIPATGLYTVPANGICDIGVYPREGGVISGVAELNSINTYISLPNTVDITGNKKFDFYLYIPNEETTIGDDIITLSDGSNDIFEIYVSQSFDRLEFYSSQEIPTIENSMLRVDLDTTGLYDTVLHIEVIKTQQAFISIYINNIEYTINSARGTASPKGEHYTLGNNESYNVGFSVWDFKIYDDPSGINTLTNHWVGYPSGDTDSAWLDVSGSADGTIVGTPTTTSFDTGITPSYTSFHPVCERAGTVLHDVMENPTHISADTPVWSESLYGSDYLNQNGFVDKADFTAAEYDWETEVDGSVVSLNDDTLVPLRQE